MLNKYQQIHKLLLIIATIFINSSCTARSYFRPNAPIHEFKEELETASPDFQEGWSDGCETGMGSGGNSFNQMFYKSNKQDGFKMAYSPDYKTAWSNAYWYCYRKDWTNQRSTIWGSIFGGYR
jgi:hypothetical protein